MSGPAIDSPTYNNESIAWKLMTTDLVTITIAFLLVVGRLYTKFFLTKAPGWEDCKNMTSSPFACVLGLTKYGSGFSVSALLIGIARVVGDFIGGYPLPR